MLQPKKPNRKCKKVVPVEVKQMFQFVHTDFNLGKWVSSSFVIDKMTVIHVTKRQGQI